ncbi:PLP-dependent aminotransferase family protein [Chitinophaga silvatica]|uniref:PLP-dependent aminotransferase family protein n=1 Tax=Chitinophaga silvatica TaxID=2282649 RepID=A0A3E1Y5Y7_9BACT|nr:PLP-dependent aminotransferase family protein [Chitinophaga silvatica]RFS20141.1 PLP-dependent aminotransferase family protein [Chitinophaga silvatica]
MLPFEHIISINKNSKAPVYRQIAVSIINAIRNGTLKAGTDLPGSRELAKMLGVHRRTVIAAYEELGAQDWVLILPKKNVTVSERIPILKPQQWDTGQELTSYENQFALPFRQIETIVSNTEIASASEIFIDDGYPDIRLSAIDILLKTYRFYISRKYSLKNASQDTIQGTPALRKELASYLSETRGLSISADNILITHGAQMSIFLSAQLLLEPQSNVIVGKPNYPNANKAFSETGANIIEVKVDENGIDTEEIESICKKKKISAVYVIPHHHYPTTVTLSVERRMKLLELSDHYSFTIIEDDYDYDYHYNSSPYLPLASGRHQGNVIYIGSFSKIFGPFLRIGFMVAPKNFIEQCTVLRRIIDVRGDSYMQNALAAIIKEGEVARQLKKAKKHYHQRRDFLDHQLKSKLGKYISYTLPPGGMAIWVKVKPEFPIEGLQSNQQLQIKSIDIRENAFRFGFASLNEKELELAVTILEGIFRRIENS